MSAIRRGAGFLLLLFAARLAAWSDPFGRWKASAYLQLLQVDRPQGQLAPPGFLDDQGHSAGGYNQDGLYARKLEAGLSGGLGWEGWDAVLGVQTDFNATGLTDAYVRWTPGLGALILKLGQERVPFGQELQVSSARLTTIQRSLAYGFENYGHVGPWGLGLLSERGWGLRADDKFKAAGPLEILVQGGGFQEGGFGVNPGVAGIGRAGLGLPLGPLNLEAAFSGFVGRNNLGISSADYAPLGAPDGVTQSTGAGLGGKATVLAWGPDASLDLYGLHGRAELALQSLGGGETRGGGQIRAWLDLPGWEPRKPALYARFDQAWTGFADGIHRPGSLLRGQAYGLYCPLPWGLSLKLEALRLQSDDFPGGFPGGSITQGQLQWDL